MIGLHQWESHKQRLVTSILMAAPLVALLALGPYWSWTLLVMVVSALGLWELQGLFFPDGLPNSWKMYFLLTGVLLPFFAAFGGTAWLHIILVAALFSSFILILTVSPLDPSGIPRFALFELGWLYIPYLLSYVLLIGQSQNGRIWIFFVLLVIIAGDVGAYYTGKTWGRHKLYETVSPKKTMEGSFGGLAASVICGVLFGTVFINGPSVASLILLSGFLALVGQLGDLIESMIKRVSGKKDSSQMIPGHGGILDRMDSLLFAFPSLWAYLHWME
jgi:phosphatidate cytidylyltransferase